MQRAVYSTRFTYVKNTVNPDGTIKAELAEHIVHESDEKKALRKAFKEIGYFTPIKSEKIAELYVLEDAIFFKYAKPVSDTLKTEGADTEETEGV